MLDIICTLKEKIKATQRNKKQVQISNLTHSDPESRVSWEHEKNVNYGCRRSRMRNCMKSFSSARTCLSVPPQHRYTMLTLRLNLNVMLGVRS